MFRPYHLQRLLGNSSKALPPKQQVRSLTLLEHHAHRILQQNGISVPHGHVVDTAEEAQAVVAAIGAPSMLKAQVLAGGRGKGKVDSDGKGGVRFVSTPTEALQHATAMLGHTITTPQTPPSGLRIPSLYIYKAATIAHEYYLALTLDRAQSCPILLLSSSGGMDIEEASSSKSKSKSRSKSSSKSNLHKYPFSLSTGLHASTLAKIHSSFLLPHNLSPAQTQSFTHIINRLINLFIAKDALLLELNPLALTDTGSLIVLDAKFEFDDDARFRQEELFAAAEMYNAMGREREEEEEEEEGPSGKSKCVYVPLTSPIEGANQHDQHKGKQEQEHEHEHNIGNIVNGAGLAMATNDLITLLGGRCANFLDIGGRADEEALVEAFRLLEGDERVKGVLVNIFGGIVRCDMIAESLINAASSLGGFKTPVVVRLQGTNYERAMEMIRKSGLQLYTETDFETAARRVIEVTDGEDQSR